MVTRTSTNNEFEAATGNNAKAAYKDLPVLGYLNIGKRVPTGNEDKTVQLAPWYGIEVKARAPRTGLSPQAKMLFELVGHKLAQMQPGETVKLNLEVELTKPHTEGSAIDPVALAEFANFINL